MPEINKFPFFTELPWNEYELIDSGNREKLERFGKYVLSRPEPQAIWAKNLDEATWETMQHARFTRQKSANLTHDDQTDSGFWTKRPDMPDQWVVNFRYNQHQFKFRLGLTSFKHVGLFPEQTGNWQFIIDTLDKKYIDKPKVLSLFAYTGGTSMAAAAAGADVTHVDSVKPVISWARQNMEMSGLSGIRWVVEDAMLFARREVKRGNHYHGIILDPPAYGRGPKGEKWLLDQHMDEMMHLCAQLLDSEKSFLILNLYSMGYSPLIAENMVLSCFMPHHIESGEMYMTDRSGKRLPLGVFCRFIK